MFYFYFSLKIAICCYTVQLSSEEQFYSDFNERCKTLNTDNWESFPYKSMWIMLRKMIFSDLIESNPPVHREDFKSYRGLKFHIPQDQIPEEGELVYFKKFTSTSIDEKEAIKFAGANGTIIEFIGKPKAGKGIEDFSQFSLEGEVLFAPWQTFKVVSVNRLRDLDKIVLSATND